jgi:predicted RNA-binding protein with TRAM domain
MPRKLPEKARRIERRRSRRYGKQKFYSPSPPSAPVEEGQEIDVSINDIGSSGDGIARIQNFPIFVPKTKVGEHLKVRITKVGRKFAVAEKLSEKENRDEN